MGTLIGRIAPGSVARLALLGDLGVLVASVVVSALLSGLPVFASPSLVPFIFTAALVWLATSLTLRHYDPWASDRRVADDLAMVSVLVMAVTTSLAVSSVVISGHDLPSVGPFLLVFWPTALVLRLTLFRALSPRSGPVDDVLVIGIGPLGRATEQELRKHRRREVLGFVRFDTEAANASTRGKVLGAVSDLDGILRRIPVGEVYFADTNVENAALTQDAIKVCERFGVPFALPAYSFRLDRARPLSRHELTDGYVHYQTVTHSPTQLALKRGFDILASGAALWVLAPLLLGVAALIRLTSKGPVLFRQNRVGLNGKPFRMLKFRTMVENADAMKDQLAAQNEMDGPVFKMKNDPRVTPLGRFLRKFSIDELPQLVNVLRGDMTVVGPRPPVPKEVAKYEGWQRRRLSVRPGLTCTWQVSGRNEISFEQWMYMDLQYIDNWTFTRDLTLILKTLPVVLTGRGAS
jgi:exopolysaccharide biosynthesis polyprenyl glycosylphosphotransferase